MNRDELNRRLHEEMTDVRVSPALRSKTLRAMQGKERIVVKRKWTVALAAALLAVLLCAAALAAAGRWGMLDFIGRYQNAYIPQDAGDYVQSDVAAFAQDGLAVNVRELYYDCDEDCLLCRVDPAGPACHTGAHSCFYRQIPLG